MLRIYFKAHIKTTIQDLDIAMQTAVSQHLTQKNGVGMGGAVGAYGGSSASVPGVSADTKPQRTGW